LGEARVGIGLSCCDEFTCGLHEGVREREKEVLWKRGEGFFSAVREKRE
tara:strand:+ start:91 stop:237 length:147 start_codon:yes stop_codon:yes gene_type:complete